MNTYVYSPRSRKQTIEKKQIQESCAIAKMTARCALCMSALKRVKIEEKLLWRAYRKSPTLFRSFGSPLYFYFRFRLYGHQNGRIAQQLVLDGTNGLSSSNPYAYCRIVYCTDIFAIAQLSCYFLNTRVQRVKAGSHRHTLSRLVRYNVV